MKESKKLGSIKNMIYTVLGIVLFILPFPRGLFFEREVVPVEFVVYVLLIFWSVYKWINHEKLHFKSVLSIGVTILPIAYLFPVLFGYAANITDAVNYVMRYAAYFAVYIIASDFTNDSEQLKKWLYPIALSGLCAGLLGLDSLAGGSIGESFGFSSIGFTWNRLYGVMQYANTMGMYFGMMFFILITIALSSQQKYIKVISSAVMFIMLSGVLLTMSRGAILLLPVVYILLFIMLSHKKEKIELLLITITPAIMTLVVYNLLQQASPIINEALGSTSKVWWLTLLGVLLTSIVTTILLHLTEALNKISARTYGMLLISMFALAIIGIVALYFSGMYTKIIPQVIIERFMQKGEAATSGRTDFYRDGLKVLKDTWLIGAGGGAWNALYRIYQSYDYGSSEAHNLFLQVWIETGSLGVMAYIGIILSSIRIYIKTKRVKGCSSMIAMLLSTVLYIIGHSMIDFNFSYFSIPIIVFTLLGTLNGIGTIASSQNEKKDLSKTSKIPAWSITLMGMVFAVAALCFVVSRGYAVQATKVLKNSQLTSEELKLVNEKLEKAIRLNPWNVDLYIMEKRTDADLQVDLNRLYDIVEQVDSENQTVLQLHYNALVRALELNPKSSIINITAARFMINKAGDIDNGIKYMDKALEYNPMEVNRYEEAANLYYELGKAYTEKGDKTKAQHYLERVIDLQRDITVSNSRAIKPITLSQKTLEYIEKAKALLQ